MTISRHITNPRMSQIVTNNNIAYLSGQIPDSTDGTIQLQAAEVLAKIEKLLESAGTSKGNILSAQIWLTNLDNFDGFNEVWDNWLPADKAPARACVEAKLVHPGWLVEIQVCAAI